MDDIQQAMERLDFHREFHQRKQTILESIESQGKLTQELREQIEGAQTKIALEDIYLPYKPKRRTRATIAKEKGLEPLAISIGEHNIEGASQIDLEAEAAKFIDEEKGVKDTKEALKGASDILAEEMAERAELREFLERELPAGPPVDGDRADHGLARQLEWRGGSGVTGGPRSRGRGLRGGPPVERGAG